MNRAVSKAGRTTAQLLVSAGFTTIVNQFADGLTPNWKAVVLAVFMVLVTFAQNFLEENGTVPELLPVGPKAPPAP